MTAPPSLAVPRDLTIPDDASTTARDVLSLSLRRLMGELRGLLRVLPTSPDERDEVARFARGIDGLFARTPALVASLLRRPTVSCLVRCLRNTLRPAADARLDALMLSRALRAQVAFELSLAHEIPSEWQGGLRVRRAPTQLLSLVERIAWTLPDCDVVFSNGVVSAGTSRFVLDDQGVGERSYVPVEGAMVLALADNNPLAMFDAHPDKCGNAIDLGGHGVEAWCATLREALRLIEAHMPMLRREIELYVQQFVPVGYDAHTHLSASYQECIGTVYLTLHPNVMTMTEAVIHEFSHNKLNALFELDPLLENAWWPLYSSPVRPDPRPLHGVVLAVHAFQPVARLYECMITAGHAWARSADFLRRYEQVKALNREGAAVVLEHARPTHVGRGLFDEMRRWDAHFST